MCLIYSYHQNNLYKCNNDSLAPTFSLKFSNKKDPYY